MKDLLNKLLGSFDTHTKNAFSARKLSAFIIIIMAVIINLKWIKSDRWEYIAEVLFLDYSFILVCLGLATWQAIKQKEKPAEEITSSENAN